LWAHVSVIETLTHFGGKRIYVPPQNSIVTAPEKIKLPAPIQ